MIRSIFYLMILALLGCIDPFEFETESGELLVTVEGFITTAPGPHFVRLSRSDRYGSVFEGVVLPISRANVIIRDNLGNIEFLQETETDGTYKTSDAFSAELGRSYTIQIRTAGGDNYISLPEMAHPVPEIDSFTVQTVVIPTENSLLNSSGAQIIGHFKDPADEKNYYQWLAGESVYTLLTNPELFTLPRTDPVNPLGSAPKDCCSKCFRYETLRNMPISIADDISFNGNATRLPIMTILDNGHRFREIFRVDIHQMSLSERAYRFLLLAKQQLETQGNIFDPPPANIRGNILSLDDPEEVSLGYFYVSDVRTKHLYIRSSDLELLQTPNLIPDDCREVEDSFIDPPSDWDPN